MDRGAPNSHRDFEQASGPPARFRPKKQTKDVKASPFVFLVLCAHVYVCVCVYLSVSLCLWKCCLYCFMVFAKMLLEITEIPHGFGQRKSTYTLVHTHSSCSKHSAEVCSLFLWSSSTLHISCHCLLKNFYFPYLNMLIYSQLSFRATWYPLHPTAAKSQFLSASLSLFLSV